MPNSSNPLTESSFFILLSLTEGPRHGYAILKDVEERSGRRVNLSVSTLYTALGRLEEQGMIERTEAGEEESGPGLPRKVYRLTRQGDGALNAEAHRLRGLLLAYRQQFGEESS